MKNPQTIKITHELWGTFLNISFYATDFGQWIKNHIDIPVKINIFLQISNKISHLISIVFGSCRLVQPFHPNTSVLCH